MKSLTRGQLSRSTGVGPEAIRYYEREGLLPAVRASNGYRYFAGDSIQRLNFIRRAKELGFNLKEIRELLSLHDNPDASRSDVKAMTKRKLAEVERRINDLQKMRNVLFHLEAECSGQGPVSGCPIIQALDQETTE